MNNKIFINLPVADLARTRAFWTALGYALNPDYDGKGCVCVILSQEVLMLAVTHDKFRALSSKGICDATKEHEVLFCLNLDSRRQVDDLVAKAVAAGGTIFEAAEDHGFMYSHSFIDPDGHGWGVVHMTGLPPK